MTRALLLLAFVTLGCHRITFRSGLPEAPTPAIEDRLFSTTIGDVVEIDPAVRLDRICPEGWASIDVERSAYSALLELLGGFSYNARATTIRCVRTATTSRARSARLPP